MAVGDVLYDPGIDYSRPALLPDGQYDMLLKGAQDDWHLTASESEALTARFVTQGENGTSGRTMFLSLSTNPKARWIVGQFMQACGVTEKISDVAKLKEVLTDCILKNTGRTFKNVVVATQAAQNGYPAKNTIRGFEPDPEILKARGAK